MPRIATKDTASLKIHKRNSVAYKMREMPVNGSVLVGKEQLAHNRRHDVLRTYARQLGINIAISDLPDGTTLVTRVNTPRPAPKTKVRVNKPVTVVETEHLEPEDFIEGEVEIVPTTPDPYAGKFNTHKAAEDYSNDKKRACMYDGDGFEITDDGEAIYNAYRDGFDRAVEVMKQMVNLLG
jgi:hypothetical protein